MLPGERSSVGGRETHSSRTEGCMSLSSAQEIRAASDPGTEGNAVLTQLISSQPPPAAAPLSESTEAAMFQTDLQTPTCPRCGPTVPASGLPPPSTGQSPRPTVQSSRRSRSRAGVAGPHQAAAAPADCCFRLLLACLSCQGSALLLGLLEACSSCLHGLCARCCRRCARCCSAIQEVPVEELNCHAHCHSVLFESCCEPTECLEFCLDCCDICHRT
ncbi:myoD family inhibitor-like [Salarias fasciatus]|uniref:myoD family inhibitor-like n=1 Tax=Salarias fasciatus TaxID=181472 RepID=UPI001176FAD9|nr:myoD family inhibitor-like [Salarias fasciatus]